MIRREGDINGCREIEGSELIDLRMCRVMLNFERIIFELMEWSGMFNVEMRNGEKGEVRG